MAVCTPVAREGMTEGQVSSHIEATSNVYTNMGPWTSGSVVFHSGPLSKSLKNITLQ